MELNNFEGHTWPKRILSGVVEGLGALGLAFGGATQVNLGEVGLQHQAYDSDSTSNPEVAPPPAPLPLVTFLLLQRDLSNRSIAKTMTKWSTLSD